MDIGQFIDGSEFKIESLIGQGAFGRVYLARDVKLNRLVAVKELHQAGEIGSTLFGDYARRFEREARVQASFNHPNIVHVYRLLTPSLDRMFLVMEYVDGGSLKDLLQQKGSLPLQQALRLMSDVLAGLGAVHEDRRDIVHRDIKPSNILLTRKGQAKLTDFGLAQVSDESMRSAGGQPHPGTPLYMSPEQATSMDYLYPVSDVFSAGCVFFELLTGAVYKQALRRRQGLAELRPDAPAWVGELLGRLLAKDPAERPCDGAEAAELLKQGEGERLEHEERERERERREKEERERLEHEARESERERREKEQRLAREKAEQEAKEQAERAAQERAEREAREKAEREAREKSERERAEMARLAAEERKRKELILELAPGVTMEFVRVPAGEFLMGSDTAKDKNAYDNETPQHKLFLPEYLIGKAPVTVAQFAVFVKKSGHKSQAPSDVGKKGDHPVTNVNWDDAVAFCQWASKQTGRSVRLPSEAQWEKAARGIDGRIWPWGNLEPDEKRCNYGMKAGNTTPVGRYSPLGDSPYGCVDMISNVWEWTGSLFKPYPYNATDGFDDAKDRGQRVLRGGSYSFFRGSARCAFRTECPPVNWLVSFGFRVVVSPI